MICESRQVGSDHEQVPQAGNVEVGDDAMSITRIRLFNKASNPGSRSTQRPLPDPSPSLTLESGVSASSSMVTRLLVTEPLIDAHDGHYGEQFFRWFLIGAAIIACILMLGS